MANTKCSRRCPVRHVAAPWCSYSCRTRVQVREVLLSPLLSPYSQQAWSSTPCGINPSENKCFQNRTLGLLINCPISGSLLLRALAPRRPGPDLSTHWSFMLLPWVLSVPLATLSPESRCSMRKRSCVSYCVAMEVR